MSNHGRLERCPSAFVSPSRWPLALAALALCCSAAAAQAQGSGQSGEQVVASVCSGCHASGRVEAAKIGDKKAWSARAEKGLTGLTREALKGIRQMPSHGGNPALSDREIERAILYMVNKSGGNWVEPIDTAQPMAERSGEEIVKLQCSKCHEESKGGPRVSPGAAWSSSETSRKTILPSSGLACRNTFRPFPSLCGKASPRLSQKSSWPSRLIT